MGNELQIEKVENGYIATYEETYDDGTSNICKEVFEDKTEELNIEVDLLYFVLNHFGIRYSKHNERNIKINIEEKEE